jgi:hypothetical protein
LKRNIWKSWDLIILSCCGHGLTLVRVLRNGKRSPTYASGGVTSQDSNF